MRFAFVLALTLLSSACSETPQKGFERFFAAVAAGSDDAYARLSTRAQAQVSAAAQAQGKEPAKYLTSAVPKTTLRSIDVVEEHDAKAIVEVKDALGNKERVTMVKEDGRWRVDLSL